MWQAAVEAKMQAWLAAAAVISNLLSPALTPRQHAGPLPFVLPLACMQLA